MGAAAVPEFLPTGGAARDSNELKLRLATDTYPV